jgi:hypothetical protein
MTTRAGKSDIGLNLDLAAELDQPGSTLGSKRPVKFEKENARQTANERPHTSPPQGVQSNLRSI